LVELQGASAPPLAALPRRDRLLILACVFLVLVLAWGYLVHLSADMAPGMEQGDAMADMPMPWTATDVMFTFAMWAVMMAGMMTAAATPVLLLFAGTQARTQPRGVSLTWLFALGYAIVWLGFSLVAALAQSALHAAQFLSPAMAATSPRVAGGILCIAGLYQLTPLKNACLVQCRTPLSFLLSRWRDGKAGALGMGIRHGLYCLGCCWALMALLFAVGVMNLLWVAGLSVLVLAEKVAPGGAIVSRIAGLCLLAGGVGMLSGVW
jgi:predicted metal-binding membrane protein